MSPPLLLLDAVQIREKALTFNECLRKSRSTNGYHTFTLLFRIEFKELPIRVQTELLVQQLHQPHTNTAGASNDPFALRGVVRRSRKNIRKLATKYWSTLNAEKKQAWNDRASIRNDCPLSDVFLWIYHLLFLEISMYQFQ